MEKQKKLVKWIGMFFGVMFLFTMIARGADSLNVANVTVKKMQNQLILHKVEGNGRIEGTRERALFVQPGQRVERVSVQEGQKVTKGELLFSVSLESLEEEIDRKNEELLVLARKVEDLESAEERKSGQKKDEKARTKLDLENAVKYGNIQMANGQMEVEAAKRKLQEFYRKRAEAQNAFQQELEGLTDGTSAETENQDGFSPSSMYTAEQEMALQEEIRAKEEALTQIIISRNQAILQAERAAQDALRAEPLDGSLENAKAQYEAAKKEMQKLEGLRKEKGEIRMPVDGVIKSLSVSTGSSTTQEAAIILYESGGELLLQGVVHQDSLKYIQVGGKATIRGRGGETTEEGIIESVKAGSGSSKERTISIRIPQSELCAGETAEFTIEKEEGPYQTCIPLAALREENGNCFVYVTEIEKTVLGDQLTAKKIEVTVKNKNHLYAALENGALSGDKQVIIDADKEIREGSPVRLQES